MWELDPTLAGVTNVICKERLEACDFEPHQLPPEPPAPAPPVRPAIGDEVTLTDGRTAIVERVWDAIEDIFVRFQDGQCDIVALQDVENEAPPPQPAPAPRRGVGVAIRSTCSTGKSYQLIRQLAALYGPQDHLVWIVAGVALAGSVVEDLNETLPANMQFVRYQWKLCTETGMIFL